MTQNQEPYKRTIVDTITEERGIALVTVMLLVIIMTILGIISITVSGLESRLAGYTRTTEASSTAAEACVDTGIRVVLQTLDVSAGGQVPVAFDAPAGPIPGPNPANRNALQAEVLGQSDNNPDTPATVPPDLAMNVNNFTVTGDIDRLYVEPKVGTSQAFDEPASGSIDILYRVDCIARNPSTGSTSRIEGVYACTFNADGCLRPL